MQVTLLQRAQAEATAFAVERGYAAPLTDSNDRLMDALKRCIDAERHIESLIATVPESEDPNNQIEVDALQWKREMIRNQVLRAGRAAKERKERLLSLRSDDDWEAERLLCGKPPKRQEGDDESEPHTVTTEHVKHWFRYWAWAYDPRADYMPLQPFVPFGLYEDDEATFQWEYIVWLHETTFIRAKSGLVEKARDMGATLGWLLWATCNWLFTDFFSALLASANEDLVDSKADPDTLFEKVRFALRMQPPQLLPAGFDLDKNMPYMNIANPENGATLSGQAPTANAGRQKRRKAVLKDESAAWPHGGFPQNTSLSAVSFCLFDVSSVQGKYNQFHVTATSAGVNKFIMDWRDHPWKDKRWYDALPWGFVGPPMSAETIAQEVDRDYDASQPGKVFKDWEETRIVVEWTEVLACFQKMGFGDRFKYVDGTLKIPDDWSWARMQDKGETVGHPRMTLYCARPGEMWPLSDSMFFFMEHMAPTAADLGTVVRELTQEQRNFHLEDSQPELSLLSHEAKNDRNIYLTEFGLNWESWDTDYDSGIGNIRLWIKPIDTHKENPIRPKLMGRSRMYLVVAPGQGKLLWNEKDKKHFVSPPTQRFETDKYGHHNFARLRAEFPVYHYPPEEAGKPVQKQRPARIFDDALVCFPKGTLIRTSEGDTPIETVTPNHEVLTRYGYQKCSGAFQTKERAIIWRVAFSDGRTLEGTPEHPIWVEGKGFLPLESLSANDIVLTCPTIKIVKGKGSSLTECPITVIPTPLNTLTVPTTKPTTPHESRALAHTMLTFGDLFTEMCRRAITYITKTTIRSITRSIILSALQPAITLGTTTQACPRRRNWPTLSESGPWQRRGIKPQKAERGNPRKVRSTGGKGNFANINAATASSRIEQKHLEDPCFAPLHVKTGTEGRIRQRWIACVLSALRRFRQPNAPPSGFAPLHVVSVRLTDAIVPVYNLEVKGHPEYFANGVLVHNCVRSVAVLRGPNAKPESEREKKRKRMAPEIQPGIVALLPVDDPDRDAIILSQQIWEQQFDEDDRGGDTLGGIPPIRIPRATPRRR